MLHNLSSCNPPRARKLLVSLLMLVGWTAHQTVFSVDCNSDAEMVAALHAAKNVVRAQRHPLDADKFPMFSVGWIWQMFCRDLDPY